MIEITIACRRSTGEKPVVLFKAGYRPEFELAS